LLLLLLLLVLLVLFARLFWCLAPCFASMFRKTFGRFAQSAKSRTVRTLMAASCSTNER
jgi:hypothetical protein